MKQRIAKIIWRFLFGKALKESLTIKKENRRFLRAVEKHHSKMMVMHIHRFASLYPRHKENLNKE